MFFADPFDPFFAPAPAPAPRKPEHRPLMQVMRTDIFENETGFVLTIELPGFAKEDIKIELKDGLLGISAQTAGQTEETQEGAFIRKERFQGSCSRRFYVGENIEIADIAAGFENGILTIKVPKKQEEPKPETGYTIAID